MFQAVQACWKKIRCPPDRGARHPTPKQASYPEPSRTDGLALSHKSKCHSRGLRHAATCLCLYVQLCVKVFSLTLCICGCQFPYIFFHCCFLLYFIMSDSSEWSRRRQGWVSNLNTFWVQTAIWHWRLGQILVYLFSHQISTSGGNTSEVCLILLKEKQAFAEFLANWVIEWTIVLVPVPKPSVLHGHCT